MDIFRNALKGWTRRDTSSTDDMPPLGTASTPASTTTSPPTTQNNQVPVPTSSPLSSLPTTDSFTPAEPASPNDTPKAGSPSQRGAKDASDNGQVGEEEDGEDEEHVLTGHDLDRGAGQQDLEPLPYHRAKPLPPELREHCRVYLEEALPRQAIFLLDSLLSTRPGDPSVPAYCPPPSQISLLSSILVHPDFTTRPKEPDWPQISLQSLVYLRDLLAVVGPINAGFKESVAFGTNTTSDLDLDAQAVVSDDADERGLVRLSPRHGNDSVWQRGRDFFSVVGWAFNCSVLYPERWQWWGRWLEFMLDLLEKDIDERHRLDMENGSDQDMPLLQNSILSSYIAQRSGRTADVTTWVMKALFADGDTPSTSVFQEVWPREHKIKSTQQQRIAKKRKRENVNIDKGEYGGYLDDESVHSSQASEPPTPQKNRREIIPVSTLADAGILETAYGETVPLRQRLFSLISYLCYNLNDAAPIDFSSLYKRFEQKVKELPLPVFSSFINSSTSALRVDQQIEMLQGVLFLFLPPAALSPRKVDRERFEEGGISPAILERCFLPYPANTIEVEDNVKMSLLLENLLMLVWRYMDEDGGEGSFSEGLVDAVNTGIEARWDKINKKKKVRGGGRGKALSEAETEGRALLEASDARLAWLAEAIERSEREVERDDAMDEDES